MKGLLRYLSPFAPDQSGASAVLFDLGGISVIVDAGGCTGNICGFDEPRWFIKKSAMFSAGLRDMDAILGRDDKMVAKLKDTAEKVDASFIGLVGTPVPAVIATDFKALSRMSEKRCGLPVVYIECTGTYLYDKGEQDTYLALFQKFAGDHEDVKEPSGKSIGVIGVTPLDLSLTYGEEEFEKIYKAQGYDNIFCYGTGGSIDSIKLADTVEKNVVVSPAGLKSAKYLQEKFGTPYEMAFPILDEDICKKIGSISNKKVLVIHQQAVANELRKLLAANGNDVNIASFFMLDVEYKQENDKHLDTEKGLVEYVNEGAFDVIIGDELLSRPLKDFGGEFIHYPHFAVSGKLLSNGGELLNYK